MGSKSKIEWTEATWNPVRGCSRVSPGCVNCYAERMAARELPGMNSPTTGEPFALMTPSGPRWTGKVELIPHMLDIPLRRKKPTTYFVNSMSDLFHESLPDEAIDRVFAVMALCPQHTFQVLTKRAQRMQEYASDTNIHGMGMGHDVVLRIAASANCAPAAIRKTWPLPNVWLGVSAEDQQRADERIPLLLQTPAAVRFISLEPLLGPVDLFAAAKGFTCAGTDDSREHPLRGIDWVIVGGESGPGARPCDVAWIRSIVKQLGARWARLRNKDPDEWELIDKKGGEPGQWPEDLRVREMPEVRR
jgi:protein gp37